LRAPYPYEPPLREAILRLKYAGARVASRDLAALMARYIQAQPLPVDALAPVPLHPQRARDRGFNQAEALAGELGRLVQLPVLHHAVQRVRNTPPQARQPNRHDRWRNMDGAFQADPAVVSGRRILVVDDVCTTGATVNACGIALQQAGAAAVWGLTLARAL
jgi:ComF family protein